MSLKIRGRKFIASCVALAIFNAYTVTMTASPARSLQLGDLSVSGQVLVNGQQAITGTTLFPQSTLTTAPDSTAFVNFGHLGRISLPQNSKLSVNFDESRLSGTLEAGGLQVSVSDATSTDISAGSFSIKTEAGAEASYTVQVVGKRATVRTQTGTVELIEGDKRLSLAPGEYFSTGMAAPKPQSQSDDDDDDGAKIAFILLGIGAVAAAIILVVTQEEGDNQFDSGGGQVNPSPTR